MTSAMNLNPTRVRRAVAEADRAAREKYPDREHHRRTYALVLAAIKLSDRPRPDVEHSCGVGTRTIEDMISRNDRTFTLAVMGPMMTNPRVLGPAACAWFVRQWIKLLSDTGVLDQSFSELDDAELEALDVGDSTGFFASLIRNARDPDSDGGTAITAKEADQIRGAGAVVEHELRETYASADREAGVLT